MKQLDKYKLVIWDLDGTLYFQQEFRLKMVMLLLKNLFLRPSKWKELFVILNYRQIRETWDASDSGNDLEMRQYVETALKCRIQPEEVKRIIIHWMHEEPLKHLLPYRDEEAALRIKEMQKQGIRNVVYSDYPTKDKLKALEICVEDSFAASDEEIGCMKPNPKGIEYILEKYEVDKKDAIMVGDRMEKDGEAAIASGIDYLILKRKRKERKKQYSCILH